MISNITKGSNFGGLLRYLLHESKQPQIVAPYMLADNASDLAIEFDRIASLRPTTQLPVRHISLSFAPADDGKVSDSDKEAIVVRVVAEMGYEDCQFIGIAHHRDDPGHDLPHDHEHLHIVVNAVNVHGERVSDSWDRFRIQPILREIERDFGLQPVKNSWELDRDRSAQAKPQVSTDLKQQVDRSLEDCPNLETWLMRLQESQIDVRFALRKDNKINGITYLQDGKAYKGSDIGASWSAIEQRVPIVPDNLPLIRAANAKSQEHRIDLGEIDRQNFNRAAVMANATLKGRERVKTGRLDIKRDGDTLTAYRMRPHRQILKAIETQGGWEPVGFPNIDRVDLNLLTKLSGDRDASVYISEEKDLTIDRKPPTIEVSPTAAAVPKRDRIEAEIDLYPSIVERQEQSDQTSTALPVQRPSIFHAEIKFDIEAITKTIHQNFADTQERIRQSGSNYSQRLDRTFGTLMSGEPPQPQGRVETVNDTQQFVDNGIERLPELAQSNSTPVTLKQIIDLKNYYKKSHEGRAKTESVDAQEKFDIYKFQISQHGKAVTGDPNLKLTNKFFKTFESDRVMLSTTDRANLGAASAFANEQAQIALEIAQASLLETKQRSRGFSR
ncbi:relaxase/mobilization nuclease domain-containing protein [Chamaesiphon minutus]|uniref:Relaxase/mobilization nuclease n=1 Tax=Chamaesiphon minutus (strain ATCC 27169 / PCC 6605) TaxID=1173020 RepID=K9UFC1_CHAP6|nr:relaxase/mobilization nuclease domain-containing protein [Chamaesiphon minutus]AFY92904.1 relaxase/mobilization nuclease [Chamaesiphon minutus PCC 6605]